MYIKFSKKFEGQFRKIRDGKVRERILKNLDKLLRLPEAGKPLRHNLKSHRRLVIRPFRIVYHVEKDRIAIDFFEHRGRAY